MYSGVIECNPVESLKTLIMETRKYGADMDVFNLTASAAVLHHGVVSIYPRYGVYNVRGNLHVYRVFESRAYATGSSAVFIMCVDMD